MGIVDLNSIPVFRMMQDKMDWLTQRQRVLAQNIANADTPGYTAEDVKPIDFTRGHGGNAFALTLATTHEAHRRGLGPDERFEVRREDDPYETSPSKNGVVLEEQLVKTARTAADYELMTGLYRKHTQMLRIALGRGAQ